MKARGEARGHRRTDSGYNAAGRPVFPRPGVTCVATIRVTPGRGRPDERAGCPDRPAWFMIDFMDHTETPAKPARGLRRVLLAAATGALLAATAWVALWLAMNL